MLQMTVLDKVDEFTSSYYRELDNRTPRFVCGHLPLVAERVAFREVLSDELLRSCFRTLVFPSAGICFERKWSN